MLSPHKRPLGEVQDKVFVYLRLQRFQAAEDLLKSAMEEHGHLANLLNLKGVLHHRQSQFAQAIEFFEKAKAANPNFIEASLNMAVTLSDLGFYDQAEKIYHEANALLYQGNRLPDLVMGRLANYHNQTAEGYQQAGLWEEAAAEFGKALQVYPRMPDIRLRLAKLFLRMGSFHQAQEQLHLLLESEQNLCECFNLLGTIAYRQGDNEEASRNWQKAQNHNPNDRISRHYLKSLQSPLGAKGPSSK